MIGLLARPPDWSDCWPAQVDSTRRPAEYPSGRTTLAFEAADEEEAAASASHPPLLPITSMMPQCATDHRTTNLIGSIGGTRVRRIDPCSFVRLEKRRRPPQTRLRILHISLQPVVRKFELTREADAGLATVAWSSFSSRRGEGVGVSFVRRFNRPSSASHSCIHRSPGPCAEYFFLHPSPDSGAASLLIHSATSIYPSVCSWIRSLAD